MGDISRWSKFANVLKWLPSSLWQLARAPEPEGPVHLMIALADHFEPSIMHAPHQFASYSEQERRLRHWCEHYPKLVDPFRDSDGHAFKHTYFYPAEQYHPALVSQLAEHCHEGWGEVELHLHHGLEHPDTSENTRRMIIEFRDTLARAHGCLSRLDGMGEPRYAFVHGNWALANSGRGCCGVDDEMEVLSETGCYADFTLPAAPNVAQTRKTNAIYECGHPLHTRAPHRGGRDLEVGRKPNVFPLIFQGPLMLARRESSFPGIYIENSAISDRTPATMQRLQRWIRAGICVAGRPDWVFVKLHCHGMDPNDVSSMLGEPMRLFLRELAEHAGKRNGYSLHFVTAREMTNIALAACDGREGNPGMYRNYRFQLTTMPKRTSLERHGQLSTLL